MELIHAIVYGIFQGVFAYLPVSSDAQIRLVQALMGWTGDESKVFTAFTAVIQLGPTLAVILFLRKDVVDALKGLGNAITGKDKTSPLSKIGMGVLVGTIPIIILGFALRHLIEKDFRSLYVVAASLILGALLMYWTEKRDRGERTTANIEVKDGLFVGFWQCLALIPGMSRSGCTLSGALFQGLRRSDAASFAFLLGIPSFSAAGIFEMISYRHELMKLALPLGVAFAISFAVACLCLSSLLKYLQKQGVVVFVWYRIVLGVLILGLLFGKVISGDDVKTTPEPAQAMSVKLSSANS